MLSVILSQWNLHANVECMYSVFGFFFQDTYLVGAINSMPLSIIYD